MSVNSFTLKFDKFFKLIFLKVLPSVAIILAVLILISIFNIDTQQNIYKHQVVSTHYTLSERQALDRSINSNVRVLSLNKQTLGISSLSGVYFKYGGSYYVLTSAHGIVGECDTLIASYGQNGVPCEEIVAIDVETDYAIFKVGEIENRTPVKIPQALAHLKKSFNILDKVYYTGYPNSIGPTTWTGTIAGFSGDYVIVQSYAWSGASGSGVFDEKGELIGIIMANDVGVTKFGYQVLNNFVLVVPAWRIDFPSILTE